jgi:hypothetical protein
VGGCRPSVSGWIHPLGDAAFASTLARYSAEYYGRDALDVALDLQSALEQICGPRRGVDSEEPDRIASPEPAHPNSGTPAPNGVVAGGVYPPAPVREPPIPMLAQLERTLPRGEHWRYEPKLDGFRGPAVARRWRNGSVAEPKREGSVSVVP